MGERQVGVEMLGKKAAPLSDVLMARPDDPACKPSKAARMLKSARQRDINPDGRASRDVVLQVSEKISF